MRYATVVAALTAWTWHAVTAGSKQWVPYGVSIGNEKSDLPGRSYRSYYNIARTGHGDACMWCARVLEKNYFSLLFRAFNDRHAATTRRLSSLPLFDVKRRAHNTPSVLLVLWIIYYVKHWSTGFHFKHRSTTIFRRGRSGAQCIIGEQSPGGLRVTYWITTWRIVVFFFFLAPKPNVLIVRKISPAHPKRVFHSSSTPWTSSYALNKVFFLFLFRVQLVPSIVLGLLPTALEDY